MSRVLLRMVACIAFSVASVAPSEAGKPSAGGGPSFSQCAPSGYNCNILITLTSQGNLQVEVNPNLACYPLPSGCYDIGQRIGFKNNFNTTVYSLSFNVKSGTTPQVAWVCSPVSRAVDKAANVRIVNIPWGPDPTPVAGNYFYLLAPPYAPNTTSPWATSCDVLFYGGIPKGGSTYFSFNESAPNFPYWVVTRKKVVAFVEFQPAIANGQTANATVTLHPSPAPSGVTVTLNLAPTSGTTGAALFTSTNTSSMTVTESPGTVGVKGTEASSTTTNIEWTATVSGEQNTLALANFSVVWVTLSFRNVGKYSDDADNSAAPGFASSAGDILGNSRAGQNNVVIKGAVSPSNFVGTIDIKRKFISLATYSDTSNGSTLAPNNVSSTGSYTCALSDQTQCEDESGDPAMGNQDNTVSSSGNIYDLDAPRALVAQSPNAVARLRANFVQFATLNGVQASDLLTWYARSSSCIRIDPGDVLVTTWCSDNAVQKGVPGDDSSSFGTITPISWDLQ